MAIIKRSELRGVLILALVILVIGGLLAVASGKLETWFGITIGGGPRLYDKIVYVSGGEVYAANPDGSDVKQLTTGGLAVAQPSVSPNGARVVFVGRGKRENQILLVRSAGGEPVALTSVTGGKRLPKYSPDGQRLAFISGGTVYVGDQDGDDLQPILPTPRQTRESMTRRDALPAYDDYVWSPDGRGLAAVMQDPTSGQALVHLPKLGGDVKRFEMPALRVQIEAISWAEQSLAAAVRVGRQNAAILYDMESKTAGALVSSEKENLGSVALSPDASKAAVFGKSRAEGGPQGILLLDTSTRQGGLLVSGDFENLSFSPAGDKLLAVKLGKRGERDVVVIDVETGELTQITSDGGSFDPAWSPAQPK